MKKTVAIYIDKNSWQYKVEPSRLVFESASDQQIEWVNLTNEDFLSELPDDLVNQGPNEVFKNKQKTINKGNSASNRYQPNQAGPPANSAHANKGVYSYTLTGKESGLRAVGNSEPWIIVV